MSPQPRDASPATRRLNVGVWLVIRLEIHYNYLLVATAVTTTLAGRVVIYYMRWTEADILLLPNLCYQIAPLI
jgi:hypothetical protein